MKKQSLKRVEDTRKQFDSEVRCKNCEYSHSPFNMGKNGYILALCPFQTHAMLLNHGYCKHFKKKQQ